jgi:hypothetical protein
MGIRPEQIMSAVLDSIKKLSDSDIKQLAEFTARLCLSDRDVCIKIWRVSLTIANVCKYSLEEIESGRGEEEEEREGE